MEEESWEIISRTELAIFGASVGLLFVLIGISTPGFVVVLDHANLLFHEAGHVFIGFLINRLEPYGGTIGQLFFPVVLAVSFWRKGQPSSFAAAVVWFFENWLNIARYMADARAQQLPLVGGGEHDWHKILGRWQLLPWDTRLASLVKTVGWIGMLAVCLWVIWRFYRDQRRRVANDDFHAPS
jgi:hypothetical protein